MKPIGWVLMLLMWGLVTTLLIFCLARVFRMEADKKKEESEE